SYTSHINSYIMSNCKNIKYIGMCCSLYDKESANVDITYANEHNIVVKGIRDYGDLGVIEYIIHELTEFLEGYNGIFKWSDEPQEISSLKCAVIGLGTSGTLIARTLKLFGADVCYYSRTRKENLENEIGIKYVSLNEAVKNSDAIFLALNKNVLLLQEEQFKLMEGKKILFNTSIGPGFDVVSLKKWLMNKNHYFFGDTLNTIGDISLWELENTKTISRSSGGSTKQAFIRLGEKVIKNIEEYINERN
ncbi:MAG: hypothetical protein K6G28_07140, partial [Acholeplasmatales bacterium]|nr:hypothetical protein [Acholeplasmatales bacterium]